MRKRPQEDKITVQRLHPCRMVRGDDFQTNLGRLKIGRSEKPHSRGERAIYEPDGDQKWLNPSD